MLSKKIIFQNFQVKKKNPKLNYKISNFLKLLFNENNQIVQSLKKNYKSSYNKKLISKFKDFKNVILVGMGGSILGAKAIYYFLNKKKEIFFL